MAIDPDTLSSLAVAYTATMTSIRGRRVQRLLKREFAGAAHVVVVRPASGMAAVLGLSATGAALCATDGRGPHAAVARWVHGASDALEARYDLLKDSLPLLATRPVPLLDLAPLAALCAAPDIVPPELRSLVARATRALAAPTADDA